MAGGIWNSQNKVLPGVYINTVSKESVTANIGTRGTVALAMNLSWGPSGTVQTINAGDDLTPFIGYDITADQALFLREMFKGSDTTGAPTKVLLYRLAGTSGAKATVTIGEDSSILIATALYNGTRGNDISIAVTADPDEADAYDVSTIVSGYVVDVQHVTAVSQLVANDWVEFTGSTALVASTGASLTGGVNPTISSTDYAAFLTAIEPYTFDILNYDGSDSTVRAAFVQFITRINESIGKKCQLVLFGSVGVANTKYVIAVGNGVKLADGTALTAAQATYWVSGVEAGALYNQSLTYAQYPDAIEANPKLSNADVETYVQGGLITFVDDFNSVKICTDINTKTTVTTKEGAEFKKNRVMRVLMQFCNDTYEYFSLYYIGKVDNNDNGRSLLRKYLIGYLNEMQSNNGIQNFTADDVEVLPGTAVDAVIVNVGIQPVDSIEKIYATVTVTANGVTVEAA
jgi:hypothetical protein